MTASTTEDVLEARLSGFLSRHGVTIADLREEIEDVLGRPLAVVATGSVLQGFGNDRSDVDVFVVVDRENLTRLPIMSYQQTARVDTAYYSAGEVSAWIDRLSDTSWPYASPLPGTVWLRQMRRLHTITRFAAGLVLDAQDEWRERLAGLHSPWLTDRVVEWWTTEAVRHRTAAGWLADSNPYLAAQRCCDAVLAALERRAAVAGQLSLTQKWVPEKLKAVDDADGLALLRDAVKLPQRAVDVGPYVSRCEEMLEALLPQDAVPTAELHYARGTEAMPLQDRVLVSRWGMRGVEVPRGVLPTTGDQVPVWRGRIDATPPAPVLSLFREDMLWLSISRANHD